MKINNFKINKNYNVIDQTKDLIAYIDKKINESDHKIFVKRFSKLTEIPEEVINYEFKKSLVSFHNFQSGKFKNILKFRGIFFSGIIYLSTIIYILVFSKKK